MVLAIAAIFASHSDWIQWEMDKAREMGLNGIGVIPRGQERISRKSIGGQSLMFLDLRHTPRGYLMWPFVKEFQMPSRLTVNEI